MTVEIIDTKKNNFSNQAVQKSVLYQSQKVAALILNFKAGQAIEPCIMHMQVLYTIRKGSGQIFIGDEKANISAGDIIVAKAGETRSIRAETDMSVLAFQFTHNNQA